MTTLFYSDTDSISQPNGLMCVHDDARQSTMCKCPQDDDYKTSSGCRSNKHYLHDLSHASSMWSETRRRRATRERTSRSSTFPVSRVTIRAKPARDAALSSWMYPPAVAQRLTDVCLPVFSSCVHLTSAHLILQQRNTICERFTTCMRHVVVIGSRGPSTRGRLTIDRRSISRLTSDLPSATCRRTPVLLTHKRSPEAVPPTKVSFAT